MSNVKTTDSLLTRLLLKHPDATPEEYQDFNNQLMKHRFIRMLYLYDNNKIPVSYNVLDNNLPSEREIGYLLSQEYPELFFKNIHYHLRRNKKAMPAALVPFLLTQFKEQSDLWEIIYRDHPELTLALASENGDWNYMLRVFQPDITLQMGSPGYYTALHARMRMFPLRTSVYIMETYPEASPPQQGRLLEILHDDSSPESRQFIRSQVGHGRKPVRQAALRSVLIRKEESIYHPVREILIQWIKTRAEISSDELPASWKDLAEITGEDSKENILIALVDPEDYAGLQTSEIQTDHPVAFRKAAIFHRSQDTLYALAIENSFMLRDKELTGAMNPKTASKTLLYLAKGKVTSFDETYIDLLKRVHPFLSETNSDLIWQCFVNQWNEFPFSLEELPLEVLALSIHPNRIKSIWQHRLLQQKSDRLSQVREVLKNRLAFLKKCYK